MFLLLLLLWEWLPIYLKKKLLCIEPLTFTGSALKWVGLQSA